MDHRGQGNNSDIHEQYRKLQPLLIKGEYSTADAVTALFVIFTFLLLCGHDQWSQWLNVVYAFADSILRTPSLAEILTTCEEYIIMMAAWFDVPASACLFQSPHFCPSIGSCSSRPATAYRCRRSRPSCRC